MNTLRLNWPLALGLGAVALVRPAVRILADTSGTDLPGTVPIALTIVVSVVWILVAGLSRAPRPLLTVLVAALTYAALAMVLSLPLSLLLQGEAAGPLANPLAIVPMLMINAVWGVLAGLLAAGVRRLRDPA